MTFDLTDELLDDIIFSMEDQGGIWYVDSSDGQIASEDMMTEITLEEGEAREDDFYPLPLWSSDDGYGLMEEFTKDLHAPDARKDLRQAISGGRGVFRNFKNVLKQYPEVERKWHLFKNEKMKEKVRSWYNDLRESWKLERLEEAEFGEPDTDEIVQNDFVFSEYDSSRDRNDVERGFNQLTEEYVKEFAVQYDEHLGSALVSLFKRSALVSENCEKAGFVCRTMSDDFAGCLLTDFCLSQAKKTAEILYFFVNRDSRGLGIGDSLLLKSMAFLKERGVRRVVIATTSVSETMKPLLEKNGFEKIGPGYVADLSSF
ncbi:MAG: GNAT family N-acetyltransferase [Treponema sp.]|nr:GNAT family N-acetyltransferase [Treponema sp.]